MEFSREYFDVSAVGCSAILVLVLLVKIVFDLVRRGKSRLTVEHVKGHVCHWLFSMTLIFILILELIEKLIPATDGGQRSTLQIVTSALSLTAVFLSLVSHHLYENKSKHRMNLISLLWLWVFLLVVYLFRVSETARSPSGEGCPLQVRQMLEALVATNSSVLLIVDLTSLITDAFKKSRRIAANLEGVEYVHDYHGFPSRITYSWADRMMMKGFKKPFELQDLGVMPSTEDIEVYYQAFKKEIEREKISSWKKSRNFSMWRCVWNVSKGTILFTGVLLFVSETMPFLAPVFLDLIISSMDTFHSNGTSTSSANSTSIVLKQTDITCQRSLSEFFLNPYILSIVMLACYLVQVLTKNYHDFETTRESIRLKAAIQACIFDKSLCLKMNLVNEGKFMNHMSVDAMQIVNLASLAHYVWSLPMQVILCLLLLFYQLGKAGTVGFLLIFFLVPINFLLGKYLGNKQDQIMSTADKRLMLTSEMLESVKLLKMYSWEDFFCQRVVNIRIKELATMWKSSLARVIAASITDGTPAFACLLTFILYYFMESSALRLSKVYSSIVIFMVLANQLFFTAFIVVCITKVRISMQRLREFFTLPQIFKKESKEEESDSLLDDKNESVKLLGNSERQKGNMNNSPRTIDDIKMTQMGDFNNHTDSTVDGNRVTSKELLDVENVIRILDATFAWHENPVLNNINFILPRGKLTMLFGSVGSGKSSLLWAILGEMERLKGSQEFCKLSLALVPQRAWIVNTSLRDNIVFGRPLDDKLYEEVVRSCTLDVDFDLLPDGDETEIGEKGANLSGGQKQRVGLARALYGNAEVYLMDDPLSALDPHVASTIFNEVVLEMLSRRGKTVLLVTHNTDLIKHADNIVIMSSGGIAYQGHPNLCPRPIIDHLKAHLEHGHNPKHVEETVHPTRVKSIPPDKFRGSALSFSLLELPRTEVHSDSKEESEAAKLVAEEERQTGATPLYFPLQYIKRAGVHLVIMAVLMYFCRQSLKIVSDYYLGVFIENSDIGKLDTDKLKTFCMFTCLSIALIPVSVLSVEKFCLNASKNIHNKIINSLAAAPMRFFDTTPIGRILNRLSTDLNIIDLMLNTNIDCFLFLMTFAICSIVTNCLFNPIFIIPALPISILAILLQRFYIASCRELQRLDCTTKSHILSHFSQALSGLHVIRTSGCEARFQRENLIHINRNNLPLLFQYLCNSWMAVRLDFLGGLIVFISCMCSLISHSWGHLGVNEAGVAMLYAICNSAFLHWSMKYLSDLEIYTSNMQRLIEYYDIKSEGENESEKPHPPPEWPTTGKIEFEDVSLTYDKSLKPVVEDLSLNIPSGHKVGICGRTGSGKSTLTLGLFRLVDIAKGRILLDHLDITSVPIRDLRMRLSIIPQDPVIFAGSIRFNLDPHSSKTDEELWEVLQVSQLHDLVYQQPLKLDAEISSTGCSLSTGEKQLLCLARAMLRNSKVLVMDEATASIDQRMDQVIQGIIKSAFDGRTVLVIAHRISTIIPSNLVLVMQGGRLIEEGDPQELLKSKSVFASMANSS